MEAVKATWEAVAGLPADVVLVQEARPPADWVAPEGVVAWPSLDDPEAWASLAPRRWSAGVIVLNQDLTLDPHRAVSGPVDQQIEGRDVLVGTVVASGLDLVQLSSEIDAR